MRNARKNRKGASLSMSNNPSNPPLSIFKKAAHAICPIDTPDWLSIFLEWQSAGTRHDSLYEEWRPKNAKQLKTLKRIKSYAASLASDLRDLYTSESLKAAGVGPPQLLSLEKALEDLVASTEQAIGAIPVSANGKTKAGRGKKSPNDALPAKTLCAAFIIEVWTFFRGTAPGPRTREAALAADFFWFASHPNEDGRWGDDPVNRWREHFERALASADSPLLVAKRDIWRHGLEQVARRGRVPWHCGGEQLAFESANLTP